VVTAAARSRDFGVSGPGMDSEAVSVNCSILSASYGTPLLLHWTRVPRSPDPEVDPTVVVVVVVDGL